MALVGVVALLGRFVAFAEADQVGCDYPQTGAGEQRNHLAVQVAPTRLTVHGQHDRTVGGSLVEVMDPQRSAVEVIDLDIVRCKRIAGKVNELFVRRA